MDSIVKVKVLSAERVTNRQLYSGYTPEEEELIMITHEVENLGDTGPLKMERQIPFEPDATLMKKRQRGQKGGTYYSDDC